MCLACTCLRITVSFLCIVGRGNCSCSQCECEEGYTGALCQCLVSSDICINPGDNTVSPLADHIFHGHCTVPPPPTHTCKTNRACVRTYVCCAHVNETNFHCIQNEVCSGNGMCDCNVCACNDGFSGRYCERCRSEEVSM